MANDIHEPNANVHSQTSQKIANLVGPGDVARSLFSNRLQECEDQKAPLTFKGYFERGPHLPTLRIQKADNAIRYCRHRGKTKHLFLASFNSCNMAMEMILRRMKIDDATVRGFRSSFRDWAGNVSNFPREIAEMALSYVIGDKAEQAYRRGDALDKRRKLMEAWANYCEPRTGNIVQLRGSGKQ